MKRVFAVAVLLFVSMALAAPMLNAQEEKELSLYERLGGVYAIATVVDDLIDRIYVNDVVNANPAVAKARTTVPRAGLKYRVTEMVCGATGGPCTYTGRTMKDAHSHLNITEKEWDAVVSEFVASLNHFKVPEKEQAELLTIVGSLKGDIVMKPAN